jgi:hypothetical protein
MKYFGTVEPGRFTDFFDAMNTTALWPLAVRRHDPAVILRLLGWTGDKPHERSDMRYGVRGDLRPAYRLARAYQATYSSRSTSRSVGNSFIQSSATATVPRPPSSAAGTVPSKAAVTPLSNWPSWLEVLTKR